MGERVALMSDSLTIVSTKKTCRGALCPSLFSVFFERVTYTEVNLVDLRAMFIQGKRICS